MDDQAKTKSQLIDELNALRRQVSALKASEETLREKEERYETTFARNLTPMAITTIEEGRYVDVNDAFALIIGRKREEIINNTATGIGYISVEQRTNFVNEIISKGFASNYEVTTQTAGQEIRHALFNSSKISIRGRDYILTVVTDITRRKLAEKEREELISELKQALSKIKTLSGLLPICASCKKIRDDKGYWNQIEAYILEHSEAEFTHGICPDCLKKLYPKTAAKKDD